jgi:hypothetical protein
MKELSLIGARSDPRGRPDPTRESTLRDSRTTKASPACYAAKHRVSVESPGLFTKDLTET